MSGGAGRVGGAVLLVPLLGLLWGFNWPAVRIGLYEIQPWTLRCLGLSLAGCSLLALATLRGKPLAIPRGQWWRIAIAGVLTIAVFNVLLAFAQLSAATSRAAIVTFTMPVWAALFARITLNERLDTRRAAGLALGVLGLGVLLLPLVRQAAFSWGLVYALVAGMSWAAGTVFTKRYPVRASAMAIAAWQLLIGAACAGVGMLLFEGVPTPGPLAHQTVIALAYHVIFAQAMAYYIWFEVVPRLPAGVSSLGTLMVPAFGVLGAVIFLGERPSASDFLGLVLITAAAASILLPRRKAARA